jgi:uncharacterized integral membrane protein (TIGR00698 family)
MNTLHTEGKDGGWITAPNHTAKIIVFMLVAAALIVWATPPVALIAGIIFALCLGNPFHHRGHKIAKYLLQICVVLLGFGMNLPVILRAGWNGSLFAALTIGTTLSLGYWIGRRLDINRNTSILISAGTAICGGSAIAAVGSVLAVTEGEIAVAMGTVFLLNAVALYLFPFLGHAMHLNQHQFGIWAGVAIHDVSSVVGAALPYGKEALETATAVKLSRTLWIIPLTLGLVFAAGRSHRVKLVDPVTAENGSHLTARKAKVEIPWFIAFFLLASLARSYWPVIATWAPGVSHVARGGLTVVLCLIGASLSPRTLHSVGWKAAVQGMLLWFCISVASLLMILYGLAG